MTPEERLAEADRLIDEIDDLLADFAKDKTANINRLVYDINFSIRMFRLKQPSTVPDPNWNNVELEEKETLEK
jgi:hypothetical protein